MSIVFIDGFDGYVSSEITNYWSDQAISGTASIGTPARTGVGAMIPRPGGVARNIGTNLTHAIVGAAFLTNAANPAIFKFSQGVSGGVQCQLVMQLDGTIGVQQTSTGSILGTSNPSGALLQPGIYNYVEWLTGFDGASLNQVYINGELVLDLALVTQGQPTPGASTVWLLGAGGGNLNLFDDFYLVNPDNGSDLVTPAGDSSVICSIPSANGDVNSWTPTPTNPNWQNVSEIPADGDTTYNASGGLEDYTVSPQLLSTDLILAAQLCELTRATGGETGRPYLSIQGAPYSTSADNYVPTTTYAPYFRMYEVEPLSGHIWTPAQYNGTFWGIRSV